MTEIHGKQRMKFDWMKRNKTQKLFSRFPGSLTLKRGELEKISGNDINVYFQLSIEMFDYLDEIVGKIFEK